MDRNTKDIKYYRMKPEELRIGNWCYPGESEYQDDPFQIDAGDILAFRKGIHKYKPIPLTKEWLIKFGFVLSGDLFHINRLFVIWNGKGFDNTDYMHYKTEVILKHVHQLQNLYFALTGEELTIE